MTREALLPQLRGIGMTMVFVATVIAFVIARQESGRDHAARQVNEGQRNPAVDLQSIASDIRDLREEVEGEDVVEQVLANPCVPAA